MIRQTFTLAGLLLAAGLSASPALATDVGVSIQVSQPGVYGRIDIGQFPRPQVVVAQPVIIAPQPMRQQPRERVAEKVQPVYLWVPPGHRQNWRRYCREYNACGVPVLFVDHRWYDDHVHPRKRKGDNHGKGRDRDDDDRGRRGDRKDRDDRGNRGKGKDD
jgi:hypothetical protein